MMRLAREKKHCLSELSYAFKKQTVKSGKSPGRRMRNEKNKFLTNCKKLNKEQKKKRNKEGRRREYMEELWQAA